MNGPKHYREAEKHAAAVDALVDKLNEANEAGTSLPPGLVEQAHKAATLSLARGQLHATLALAAATASPLVDKYMGDSDRTTDWGVTIGWNTAPERATADEDVEAPALYKPHWLTSDVDAGPKRKTIACHCQIAEDHDGRERTWPEMVPDAACGAVREETGIKCGKPAGHTDHHKGTGTDEYGELMASLWSNTEADGV